jgi:phage terminase small subunit
VSRRKQITTNTGHVLSPNEDKFISLYLELGNASESVKKAGFKTKNPRGYAQTLLTKEYIVDEIRYRRDQAYAKSQATSAEVMDFFARVMRGEVKDQFGLETPVSERLKAADALAKRTVDIDNRMAGKKDMQTPEIAIKLDWTRNKNMEEENDGE